MLASPALILGPIDPAHAAVVAEAQAAAAAVVADATASEISSVQADARLEAAFWFADAQLTWSAQRREGGRVEADATRLALDLAFCRLREELGRQLFHD